MNQLTTREKNLLIIAAAVLVSVVLLSYAILPIWESYQQTSAQLESAGQRLAELKKAEQELANGTAREKLVQQLAEVNKKLPNGTESAELTYYLQKAVNGQGAILGSSSIAEQKESGTPGLLVSQVSINTSGSYDQVQGVLKNLENFPRTASIQQVNLVKETPPKAGLNASFVVDAYIMPKGQPYVNDVVPKIAPIGKTNPF